VISPFNFFFPPAFFSTSDSSETALSVGHATPIDAARCGCLQQCLIFTETPLAVPPNAEDDEAQDTRVATPATPDHSPILL